MANTDEMVEALRIHNDRVKSERREYWHGISERIKRGILWVIAFLAAFVVLFFAAGIVYSIFE